MRRSSLIIAGAWLACLPVAAPADPPLSFGPDIPLFITATASVRHDDNVNLAATNKVADTVYILEPGLDYSYNKSQIVTSGVSFNEQFVRYASHRDSALNSDLADLQGNFSVHGSVAQIGIVGSYVQENQSALTINNLNGTISQSATSAGVNGAMSLTAKTGVDAGATFTRTEYPQSGFDNNDVWNFPVDLYYAVTPKVDLSLGYERMQTKTKTGVGDANANFYNVGARGDFTPKLSGQVRVGVTQNSSTGVDSGDTLGLNGNLNYQATPKTSFALSGQSGFTVSPLGNTEKDLTVGLNGTSAISQAWNVTFGGSYNTTHYFIVLPRVDHFVVGDVGLNYIWTQETNFQLQYQLRKDTSTVTDAGFDDSIFSFMAATRF